MKRGAATLLAAAAALTVGVATGSPRIHVPTQITHDASVPLDGRRVLEGGQVNSRFFPCRGDRSFVLFGYYRDHPRVLLDRGFSTDGGAWAAKGDPNAVVRMKLVVHRTVVRTPRFNGHVRRRVCQPAALTWRVD